MNVIVRPGTRVVDLSWAEVMRWKVFCEGEIAAYDGGTMKLCPYAPQRDPIKRMLWFRGFIYGGKKGVE